MTVDFESPRRLARVIFWPSGSFEATVLDVDSGDQLMMVAVERASPAELGELASQLERAILDPWPAPTRATPTGRPTPCPRT